MTYGVAWIYGDTAFIVADTSVTYIGHSDDSLTSLNENLRPIQGRCVSESLLKIQEIKRGVACTFAGDVQRAHEIIDFLCTHAKQFDSPEPLFDALNLSIESLGPERSVEVLLAWSDKGRAPAVFRWDTTTRVIQFGSLLQIGSLEENHRTAHAYYLLSNEKSLSHSPDLVLTLAIAAFQTFSFHDDLVKQSVAGIVCGMYVRIGETRWQPDTITLPVTDGRLHGYIASLFRDGALFIDSPFLEFWKILFNDFDGDKSEWLKNWTSRWHKEVSCYVPDGMENCRHWIFSNIQYRVLTVFVVHTPMSDHREVLQARRAGEGFELEMGENFREIVFRRPRRVNNPGLGIDCKFIEGPSELVERQWR